MYDQVTNYNFFSQFLQADHKGLLNTFVGSSQVMESLLQEQMGMIDLLTQEIPTIQCIKQATTVYANPICYFRFWNVWNFTDTASKVSQSVFL